MDKARPVERVVSNGESLTWSPEEDLLVRDETRQSHRVHLDSLTDVGTARARDRLTGRGIDQRGKPGVLSRVTDRARRGERRSRRGIGLLVVVQFNDLDPIEVRRRHRGETLGEHGTDGEVRRHHHAGLGARFIDGAALFGAETSRTDDESYLVRRTPVRGRHDALGRGEVDHDVHAQAVVVAQCLRVGGAVQCGGLAYVNECRDLEVRHGAQSAREGLTHATSAAHDDQAFHALTLSFRLRGTQART